MFRRRPPVILFAYVVAWSAHAAPDVTSSRTAQAVTDWLHARTGGEGVTVLVALSALSYVPFIVFLAGLRRWVATIDATGIATSVVGFAGSLFLAGEIAGDTSHAVRMSLADASAFSGSSDLVIAFDRVWLVSTIEAHVALGVVLAAVAIASLRVRSSDDRALPAWVTWWGFAGLVSVVPAVFARSMDVLIATNLVRLSWIFAVSVTLLQRSARRSAEAPH